MFFSIIICTYNGAERLPATLQHLAALHLPDGGGVELLLVNNACTDNTDWVVQTNWDALLKPYPLRILHMPNPGKTFALELGILNAKGNFIIICDDDNWLMPDYLRISAILMNKYDNVGILGGQAQAIADVPLPVWFTDYQLAYACGSQMPVEGITTGIKLLWGAGMVIRAKLAKKIFNSDFPLLLTCRKGAQLISGGDDEICLRCWLLNMDTYYSPALQLHHFMPAVRLTETYRDQLTAGFAAQGQVIGTYRRLYALVNSGKISILSILKKWVAWRGYRLNGKQRQALHAGDSLYFLTRAKRWETPENRAVYQFYEKSKKAFNN